MIDALAIICSKVRKLGEWPTTWTQSLIITFPKKGNLQLCQNYLTISLISHPSKVMLKVIPTRLKPLAENIIAEEKAGFRAGKSTTEQISNVRILCEKNLQHQQDSYHAFIDFNKAFDRVWHSALWATMKKYHIGRNLIHVIEQLYTKASSAVLLDSTAGEWFHTTVGVLQGCPLSPDALEGHIGTVSTGGRTTTNLRCADCIDAITRDEQELANIVKRLEKKHNWNDNIREWTGLDFYES